MKIINNATPTSKLFKDLKVGDCFHYVSSITGENKDNVYIKIDCVDSANCVLLNSGSLGFCSDKDTVIELNCVMTVFVKQ